MDYSQIKVRFIIKKNFFDSFQVVHLEYPCQLEDCDARSASTECDFLKHLLNFHTEGQVRHSTGQDKVGAFSTVLIGFRRGVLEFYSF